MSGWVLPAALVGYGAAAVMVGAIAWPSEGEAQKALFAVAGGLVLAGITREIHTHVTPPMQSDAAERVAQLIL